LQFAQAGSVVAINTGRTLPDVERFIYGAGMGPRTGCPQVLICNERDIYRLQDGQYALVKSWYAQEYAVLSRARSVTLHWATEGFCAVSDDETQEERGFLELFFATEDLALQARSWLQRILQDEPLKPVRNGAGIALRLRCVGKGTALVWLTEALGIPRERVLCIGDSHNDIDMLGREFHADAPANADAEVKRLVQKQNGMISSSKRSEGVADILRTWWRWGRARPS